MSILYIDLDREEIRSTRDREERGYFLARCLMEGRMDRIVFIPVCEEALRIKGASSSPYAFFSPMQNRVHYGYSNLSSGLVLSYLGYTALVITGRARKLSYISIRGNAIEIRECEELRKSSYSEFSSFVREKNSDIVLATGRAADCLIRCAALYENGEELSRGGFGYAFSSLNLKGICVQSHMPKRAEDEEGRKYLRALDRSRFAKLLKRDSTTGWIKNAERSAFLPIENFTRRHDARAIFLDGSYLKEKYGAYSVSCADCPASCKRILQDGSKSPNIIQMMALGSMQNIFSADKVLLLKSAVEDAGLETVEAGAMLASMDLSFEDKLKALKAYDGTAYASYKMGGQSTLFDLRGSGEAAIFMILGDDEIPAYSLYAPVRVTSDRIAAILAIFERIYRYALSSRSLPVMGTYAAYISTIPRVFYKIPLLLRLRLEHMFFFKIDGKELMKEGLEILNMIGEEENPVPEHFIYTSSSKTEVSTVRPARLLEFYKREKRRLEGKYLNRFEKRKG